MMYNSWLAKFLKKQQQHAVETGNIHHFISVICQEYLAEV